MSDHLRRKAAAAAAARTHLAALIAQLDAENPVLDPNAPNESATVRHRPDEPDQPDDQIHQTVRSDHPDNLADRILPFDHSENLAHRTLRSDHPDWSTGRAGRLVERWLPGGTTTVTGLRAHFSRHRLAAVVLLGLTALITAIVLVSQRPTAEPAPDLPAAVNAAATQSAPGTSAAPTSIVVSVVGRVVNPGLVTLPNGARVADAVSAAGGVPPGTDLIALNLARRLSDGEQIYVGIPIPPGASTGQPASDTAASDPAAPGPAAPPAPGGKGKKAPPTGKVDLNTASMDQLESLPGVGPTTAQRIVTYRSQHGSFSSINQLRDVGGIGEAKFAKLQDLVTV